MVSAFVTVLPASSPIPPSTSPLLVVDAHVTVAAFVVMIAVAAAIVIARLQARFSERRPRVRVLERRTGAASVHAA